jgi:ribulose-phosphate 3-epimerase
MTEVIPTIIAKDFQELKEKIRKVEPYVSWAQLDVMDGKFVKNTTWNNPKELKELETGLGLEAHLMIENPEEKIDDWINSGVKRIIIHYESTKNVRELIIKIRKAGLDVGIAINPETDIKVFNGLVDYIDLIMVMTVRPGRGGQKFLEESLGKIKDLRERYENVKISVDGGINLETAPKAIQAVANILSVNSAIFKSGDIEKTINDLKTL